jgi:hypothetical protein
MTMALVPIEATRPVDPIWTYHRRCLGPPDLSWREVYRGPLPVGFGEGRRGVGRPRLVPRSAVGADLRAG